MQIKKSIQVKVSVIVPIYNAQNTLEKCLDSLLSQTLQEIELLCINDGSNDNSFAILKQYAAKDVRVKVITQKNAGVSAARNVGLDNARGEFIAFMDSDDWAESNMLKRMYKVAKRRGAQAVVCNYWRHNPNVLEPAKTQHRMDVPYARSFISDYKLFGTRSYVWDKLFARSLIENSGARFLEDEHTHEEFAVVYRWLYKANNVVLLDDALMHHNNDNSASLMSGGCLLGMDMLHALERLSRWFLNQKLPREGIDQLCAMNMRHILYRFAEFRQCSDKAAKIEFIDAAFSYLDRTFLSWRKNPYYTDGRKGFSKLIMKCALWSPFLWRCAVRIGLM